MVEGSKRVKETLTQYNNNSNKEVKNNKKKDKNQWFEDLVTKTEKAASEGNLKVIYDITSFI